MPPTVPDCIVDDNHTYKYKQRSLGTNMMGCSLDFPIYISFIDAYILASSHNSPVCVTTYIIGAFGAKVNAIKCIMPKLSHCPCGLRVN